MSRPRFHQGGRPAASRTVRLVPLRRAGLDHRELARVLLAVVNSGARPVGKDTDKKVPSVRSNEPGTAPTSQNTTTTSAASVGPSAVSDGNKEGLS